MYQYERSVCFSHTPISSLAKSCVICHKNFFFSENMNIRLGLNGTWTQVWSFSAIYVFVMKAIWLNLFKYDDFSGVENRPSLAKSERAEKWS